MCDFQTASEVFTDYHKSVYGEKNYYHIKAEECTHDKIQSLDNKALIPWRITKAVTENSACTWKTVEGCQVIFPSLEDCMLLAAPFKT